MTMNVQFTVLRMKMEAALSSEMLVSYHMIT